MVYVHEGTVKRGYNNKNVIFLFTLIMAEQNPKVQKWLDIGKRRFAEEGIHGIKVNEMSDEIGIAKTSFYFFFTTKEEYLNQLFSYWQYDGTERIFSMVSQIQNPVKRFLALIKMIEDNSENEAFYFQLKLYAKRHKHARRFLELVEDKRAYISNGIFKDAGFSDEDVEAKRRMMKVFIMGHQVLMTGYNYDPIPEYSKDEILELFGLNKYSHSKN